MQEGVSYFDIFKYIDKFKISNDVLDYAEEVSSSFDNYLKALGSFTNEDAYLVLSDWLDSAYNELYDSSDIERKKAYFSNKELLEGNLLFDTLKISEKRIKDIHSFVCKNSDNEASIVGEYRKDSAWVGYYESDNTPHPFWWGAKSNDIKMFMKDFVTLCNKGGTSVKYSNPFIKSALIHLLFIKIHPFSDCNGRTGRIIHNIVFTDMINDIYGTRLKLCPMNISKSIYLNKITYNKRIDAITFNLEDDNSENINKWLIHILNMYEEQINYHMNRVDILNQNYEFLIKDDLTVSRELSKSRIKRLIK